MSLRQNDLNADKVQTNKHTYTLTGTNIAFPDVELNRPNLQ